MAAKTLPKPNNIGKIYDSCAPETVLSASTIYVEIPMHKGTLGLFLKWADATSSATITLETTNDMRTLSSDAASDKWFPESTVTITGPTGAAAGCSMKHLGNIGAARARLKIVATADTRLQVFANFNEA